MVVQPIIFRYLIFSIVSVHTFKKQKTKKQEAHHDRFLTNYGRLISQYSISPSTPYHPKCFPKTLPVILTIS